MKLNYFLILLLIIVNNNLFSKEEFLIYHLNHDYNGSCYFDGKIIVFGETGDFIVSEDNGENWHREHIFVDTVSIVKLISQDDILIGATKDGTFFTLDKNFKVINQNSTYKGQKITSFDRFNDTTFSATTNDYNIIFFKSDLAEFYKTNIKPYQSTSSFKVVKGNSYDFIAVCNNRIFFENYDHNNTLSLKITDFKVGNEIYNLYRFNNEIYVDIDGKLFTIDETKYIPEKITKDSTGGIKSYKSNFIFNIKRNDEAINNFGTIGFYQLIDSVFQRKCVLNYERLIYKDFEIKDVNVIDENTIVSVGTRNAIFISHDGGFRWEIVSYFNPEYTVKWLNEKIGFFSSFANQLYRTTDGGTTFLPQKKYDEVPYKGEYSFLLFDINESGQLYRWSTNYSKNVEESKIYNFMLSENFGEDYECKWIDGIFPKHTLSLFHPAGYNLVKFKNYNFHNLIHYNPDYTYFIRIETNSLFDGQNDINVTNVDSVQTFLITATEDKIWAYCVKGDSAWLASSSDLQLLKWSNEFSFNDFTVNHKVNGFEGIFPFKALTDIAFNTPFIITVKDSSSNIDPTVDFITGKIIKGDFKYFEIRSHFYIDLKNAAFKLIYRDTLDVEGVVSGNLNDLENLKVDYKPGFLKTTHLMPFLVDDNQVYFRKKGTFLERPDGAYSCDVSDVGNTTWVPDLKKIQLANFDKYNSTSNLQTRTGSFQKLSENKFVTDFAILEKGKAINKVQETERKNVYMYKYMPYPQPASNYVKVKIYTNNLDCFNPDDFSLFNSDGVMMNSKNQFTIEQTGINEAEIKWDCSNYRVGVYLIKLNCESSNDIIKVIKN